MMTLHLGRHALSKWHPAVPTAIISITDPSSTDAWWEFDPLIVASHRVAKFHDVDTSTQHIEGLNYIMFNEARADAIAEFMHGMGHNLPDLVLAQCEAGVSRSAGVIAAIQSFYRLSGMSAFSTGIPNRLVFRLTLLALQKRFDARIFDEWSPKQS